LRPEYEQVKYLLLRRSSPLPFEDAIAEVCQEVTRLDMMKGGEDEVLAVYKPDNNMKTYKLPHFGRQNNYYGHNNYNGGRKLIFTI
jgi:hypothetical protein